MDKTNTLEEAHNAVPVMSAFGRKADMVTRNPYVR
jgi:hypothetical protein